MKSQHKAPNLRWLSLRRNLADQVQLTPAALTSFLRNTSLQGIDLDDEILDRVTEQEDVVAALLDAQGLQHICLSETADIPLDRLAQSAENELHGKRSVESPIGTRTFGVGTLPNLLPGWWRSLQRLHLIVVNELTLVDASSLVTTLSRCSALEELEVGFCQWVSLSNAPLESLAGGCPHMRIFSLWYEERYANHT